ncbi:MAG: homoserine kinase [Aquificaceae bacterium]
MLRIVVPASTSNLGCGFDTFGLALELYNEFVIEPAESFSVYVEGEGKNLPKDEKNLFIKAYKKGCDLLDVETIPLRILQRNGVPTARGLGSSATAIVGGVVACERINKISMSIEERLKVALSLEPHPDNVLPALIGSFVVCASDEERVLFTKLDFPEDIKVVVAIPSFELSTQKARDAIKKEVSLQDAVKNVQRASLLVSSLCIGRYDLLREAVKDRLHQPYRAKLIPGFYSVMEEAYRMGALAVFLSGAGPSVASFCKEKAHDVGLAMVEAFKREKVKAKYIVLKVDTDGVKVYDNSNP